MAGGRLDVDDDLYDDDDISYQTDEAPKIKDVRVAPHIPTQPKSFLAAAYQDSPDDDEEKDIESQASLSTSSSTSTASNAKSGTKSSAKSSKSKPPGRKEELP